MITKIYFTAVIVTVVCGLIGASAAPVESATEACSVCADSAATVLDHRAAQSDDRARQTREDYVRRAVTGRRLPSEVAGKRQRGSGSGFFVSPSEFVTNHHVVDGCAAVTVRPNDRADWLAATIIGDDAGIDLAALRIAGVVDRIATFRVGSMTKPPKKLTILGYPELGRVVVKPVTIVATPESSDLTSGRPVFRLLGLVRHGMSGSPVLDEEGRVLGVISRRVNPLAQYHATGEVPETDIGLAISSGVVLRFLRELGIAYRQDAPGAASANSTSLEDAQHYVAQVGCWK